MIVGRMKRFGMDTYVYAPKDDYKHRLYWRELYQGEEAGEVIQCSKVHISFVQLGLRFQFQLQVSVINL